MPEEKKLKARKMSKDKFGDLVGKIEQMTVQELNNFVGELEDKFGPVVMAAGSFSASAGSEANDGAGEEKSEYDIQLTSAGSSPIGTIKAVKEVTGLGLVEAKKLVDSVPTVIREKIKKEEAEEIKKKLEAVGATVELR